MSSNHHPNRCTSSVVASQASSEIIRELTTITTTMEHPTMFLLSMSLFHSYS